MAKEKKVKAKKAKKGKGKGKMPWTGQLVMISGILLSLAFLQSTILIVVGMLPTLAAAVVDRTGKGTLAITIGAMNLAGCSPFLIQLWMNGHELDMGVEMLSNPFTIIVMYSGAAIGYVINWSLSGVVEALMVKKYSKRLEDISKRQEELEKRWGKEVTGAVTLDPFGFPLEKATKSA